MTKEERESIVAQLAFVSGRNKSVYEKLTDEQLIAKLEDTYKDSDA